ncbi:hypothetical protein EDC04DRAFT_2604992 [Pisolithus marmoratus]|nr:hypothetical protein EDC04DRAFT_2604992 [Pisolithus marmoratus]
MQSCYRAASHPTKHLPEFYKEKGKMSLLQLIMRTRSLNSTQTASLVSKWDVAQKASNPFWPSVGGRSAQWRRNNFATFPKTSEGKRMLPDAIRRPLHSERRFGGLDSSSSPDTIRNTVRTRSSPEQLPGRTVSNQTGSTNVTSESPFHPFLEERNRCETAFYKTACPIPQAQSHFRYLPLAKASYVTRCYAETVGIMPLASTLPVGHIRSDATTPFHGAEFPL